ncbi:catalase [Ornithinibacillus halotolerans]|uniref:Catalase n=1 Tax=Ornithinibacillus halotolerans TaxID=1274357 RepID=A0A916WCA2_9BACI|nr:catalase [Ornithinibacillus halotolerans]GGA86674.1 catalase-2 [Ornithinibacillus halotolerans]
MDNEKNKRPMDKKDEQLEKYRRKNTGPGKKMTDDTGVKVSNDQTTLRAGRRGPGLWQDFHFYKKQSHFDRERIPEKVVHARGFGVYGVFENYKSLKHLTAAHFLGEAGRQTSVFVRFSNFVGNRGSKDTAVDIRGFATKFYTEEGNYDMLALQFPVFILADGMKFMDVTHAAKPNPKVHIPQATTAHDEFWDYVANNQESAHMVMWLMSMRGRPRSWRMMAGWPINTFILINEQGNPTFVRFKWTPKLGVHSLLLDEANIIGGVDPDFHRRDIVEAIQKGAYPEYELGMQLIDYEDEFKYEFDVLDDTKHWPEEVIPVQPVGKMTLDRLVDNFFAEEEQSAFDPANLVPGIDFSNDPVLQSRAFPYRDTELHRHHSANFENLPVNKPIVERNYNLRRSYLRHRIDVDNIHYHKNSLAGNTPEEATFEEGGFVSFPEKVEGRITREVPSDSFNDFFSQARLFWNSISDIEKQDLLETFTFHLQYVKSKSVRQQNVEMWANVDRGMACYLAEQLGVEPPKNNHVSESRSYPSISQLNTPHSAYTQKVGILIGNGFNGAEVRRVMNMFEQQGVFYDIISEKLGVVTGGDGTQIEANETFLTKYAVLYDSLYVVGGRGENQAKLNQDIMEFVRVAYKYYKSIGVATTGSPYIRKVDGNNLAGVVFAANNPNFEKEFLAAIAKQRFWNRT